MKQNQDNLLKKEHMATILACIGDGVISTNIHGIKFTENGEVCLQLTTLSKHEDNIEIQFAVKDTGIGISEVDREKLFKSFTQVDGSFSRKYGGTRLTSQYFLLLNRNPLLKAG